MKTLLIIPAYNEMLNLPGLIDIIRRQPYDWEIVVINDCSTDSTADVCTDLGVNVISLSVNLGIGGAVQTGLRYARQIKADIAVQVDGDGQHNPEYIRQLEESVLAGNNMCIGSRFINNDGYQSTNARRAGIKFYQLLIKLLTGKTFTDPTSGFRSFDKKAIDFFSSEYPSDYPEPESIVMLIRKKMSVSEIPVKMNQRLKGKSSINRIKSVYYMVKVTIAVCISNLPGKRS